MPLLSTQRRCGFQKKKPCPVAVHVDSNVSAFTLGHPRGTATGELHDVAFGPKTEGVVAVPVLHVRPVTPTLYVMNASPAQQHTATKREQKQTRCEKQREKTRNN